MWSNAELRRVAPLIAGEVVNVSGSEDDDKEGGHYRDYFTRATSYAITNYTGYRGVTGADGEIPLDLTRDLPADLSGRFDAVFNHTTLEHIFDTRGAFARLCQMSRDLVVVVVPFAQATHWSESFGDFWRFTPMGLRAMFEENGLDVVHEAAGPPRGEPVYLLFVGSRQADHWRGVLPAGRVDAPIGAWIGGEDRAARIRHRAAGGVRLARRVLAGR